MSPHYFHARLTFYEARDYLTGMQRRAFPRWEAARLVADVVARVAGNRDGTGLRFPWEEAEEDSALPTEEEIAEMLREREEWEQRLKKEQ